jgi:hypothetical protein
MHAFGICSKCVHWKRDGKANYDVFFRKLAGFIIWITYT